MVIILIILVIYVVLLLVYVVIVILKLHLYRRGFGFYFDVLGYTYGTYHIIYIKITGRFFCPLSYFSYLIISPVLWYSISYTPFSYDTNSACFTVLSYVPYMHINVHTIHNTTIIAFFIFVTSNQSYQVPLLLRNRQIRSTHLTLLNYGLRQ